MGGFGKKAGAEDGSGYTKKGGDPTEAGPGDRRPYQEAVPLWGGAWGDDPEEEPEEGGASSLSGVQQTPG